MRWQLWLSALTAVCALGGALVISSNAYAQAGINPSEKEQAAMAEQLLLQLQAQEAVQKQAIAEWIIAREEAASGRAFDPGFRATVKAGSASLSLAALSAQMHLSGLGPLNLGDSQADLVYTPLTPCRLFDTRISQGGAGPIPAGGTRDFKVTGLCGVPVGPATAAVINFVAVNAGGPGDLRVTPFGTPMPAASIINYAAVQNIANAPAIKICDPAVSTCTFDITIQADVSATDVLGDVQGYFRKVRKEQVKSFAGKTTTSAFNAVGTTCTNYSGGTITITAPPLVSGNVLVRADVIYRVNHTVGTEDFVQTYIGTTATTCDSTPTGVMHWDTPSALPSAFYFPVNTISGMFPVAGGSVTTFFLNAARVGGLTDFWWGAMDATFIPD